MPRLILKCPYTKGGRATSAAHLQNYISYIATRERVDKIDGGRRLLSATKNQQKVLSEIISAFPESKEMHEYDDFLSAPTRENASDFISRALEENLDQIAKLENYVDYIAMRPRAEKMGMHGLFTSGEKHLVLDQVVREIGSHMGNVWKPIFSLRREDAKRLGYDNGSDWRNLVSSLAPQISAAMKIKPENFRWHAAFHDESHHPHVHMICYSTDPKEGFLTKQGIRKIKSLAANRIFRQDLLSLYEQQSETRDELVQESRNTMQAICKDLRTKTISDPELAEKIGSLSKSLLSTPGKKMYQYLPAPIKAQVDAIVNDLTKKMPVSKSCMIFG
ncbi:MobP3 family relaxase [Anaerotruncus rubiinfantis]|uniref:MobP3 family relaxase n=1 Tax=Anaerotruncus rubiinfantis TaxID=1720200 RepID=UPI0034A14BF2